MYSNTCTYYNIIRIIINIIIMDNSFYNRYLKYKNKYLALKNNIEQTGGAKNKNIIIHISGPSGAGKTTLGNKLKDKFGNKNNS